MKTQYHRGEKQGRESQRQRWLESAIVAFLTVRLQAKIRKALTTCNLCSQFTALQLFLQGQCMKRRGKYLSQFQNLRHRT